MSVTTVVVVMAPTTTPTVRDIPATLTPAVIVAVTLEMIGSVTTMMTVLSTVRPPHPPS